MAATEGQYRCPTKGATSSQCNTGKCGGGQVAKHVGAVGEIHERNAASRTSEAIGPGLKLVAERGDMLTLSQRSTDGSSSFFYSSKMYQLA